MLAMHGAKSLKPCTICLVPRDALHRLDVKYPHRSKSETSQIIRKGPAEELLQSYGLQAHEVWNMLKLVPSYSLGLEECVQPDSQFRSALGHFIRHLAYMARRSLGRPHSANHSNPRPPPRIGSDSMIREHVSVLTLRDTKPYFSLEIEYVHCLCGKGSRVLKQAAYSMTLMMALDWTIYFG